MKLLKPSAFVLLTCLNCAWTFSQTSTILNYLPENAKTIIKINPARLAEKMSWEEFTKTNAFESMVKDLPDQEKTFFENPAHPGIDLNQGLFFLIPASTAGTKAKPVLYGFIKDTAAFAATAKKIFDGVSIVKAGAGKLMIDKNNALAWNNDIFILTNEPKKALEGKTGNDLQAAKTNMTRQLTLTCRTILTKQKKAFSNEYFTGLLQQQGDILLWMNNMLPSQAQKKSKMPAILTMFNKNFTQGGNYSASVINFENGKIVMQTRRFVSSSLDSAYRKYPVNNINTDVLKKLPAGNVILLGSFSFSPEMIGDMLASTGMDKYIDSMSKNKVKADDIVSAIKGNISFAVVKAYEFTEDDSVTQALNGIQVFLAGTINDKEKFKNVSSLLQPKMSDTTNGAPSKKMKFAVSSNDSIFVMSISKVAAEKFLTSGENNDEVEKLVAPYKDYPAVFMLDLKTILGLALQSSKGKTEDEAKAMSRITGAFDKLVSYGGRYSDGSVSGTTELEFSNKDENSLRQVVDLAELFYQVGHKKKTGGN